VARSRPGAAQGSNNTALLDSRAARASSRSTPASAIAAAALLGGAAGGLAGYLAGRKEAACAARSALDVLPMAKRIILIRHGESRGNVDRALFSRVPDHLIPLTQTGRQQARAAGGRIKAIIGDEPVLIFCSPYERTRQTCRELRRALDGNEVVKVREEPRLREQEFGNFQNPAAQQEIENLRHTYGRFFYRIPQGESGADVFDRVSSFMESLFRSFRAPTFSPETNVILVTHGLTLRLFLTRFFHWPVEIFERTSNPGNAEFVVMQRCHNYWQRPGTYRLTAESATVVGLTEHDCHDADVAEDADRALLNSPDIHRPVEEEPQPEPEVSAGSSGEPAAGPTSALKSAASSLFLRGHERSQHARNGPVSPPRAGGPAGAATCSRHGPNQTGPNPTRPAGGSSATDVHGGTALLHEDVDLLLSEVQGRDVMQPGSSRGLSLPVESRRPLGVADGRGPCNQSGRDVGTAAHKSSRFQLDMDGGARRGAAGFRMDGGEDQGPLGVAGGSGSGAGQHARDDITEPDDAEAKAAPSVLESQAEAHA
jgi:broad specificity phosphatase PhoE